MQFLEEQQCPCEKNQEFKWINRLLSREISSVQKDRTTEQKFEADI
jgi:hypothetical protein